MSTAIIDEPHPQDLESTWAAQNPVKPVISIWSTSIKRLTDAEKITAHGRKVITEEKAAALHQAIDTCLAAHEAEAKCLT